MKTKNTTIRDEGISVRIQVDVVKKLRVYKAMNDLKTFSECIDKLLKENNQKLTKK